MARYRRISRSFLWRESFLETGVKCGGGFLFIGYLGMWEDTMRTMSIILVSTFVAIVLGVPTGIAMASSNRIQSRHAAA